jgi:hypothetical protein
MGAVIYMHKVQVDDNNPAIVPSLAEVLAEFEDIFQEPKDLPPDIFQEPKDLPPARYIDHRIPLQNEFEIVNTRPYRLSFKKKDTLESLIMQLLHNQVIRPSVSPYSSPAILVKKKDGTWRLCIDYRKLNTITVKNKYPIPVIEDLLDELHGAQFFNKIDLRSGYHQIRMHHANIAKTAFSTHKGHFEYIAMSFDLTNAPATFQTLMNKLLQPFLKKFALVFFDDILIYNKTTEEHCHHVQQVQQTLREK